MPDSGAWDQQPRPRTQADLDPDLAVVVAFGAAHEDVWGGVQYDGDRLRVGLTELGPVADALVALLPHPEAVDVHWVPFTVRHLEAVQDELTERLVADPSVRGLGRGSGGVQVRLRPRCEALAAELRARYGDAVEVEADEGSAEPWPGPVPTVERPDLRLEVLPDRPEVVGGQVARGRLRVTAVGPVPVHLETDQPLTGLLLGAGGEVVGSSDGFETGTGLTVRLRPGESEEIAWYAGTESRTSYVTAPGDLVVVVVLPLHDLPDEDDTDDDDTDDDATDTSDQARRTGQLVSPPAPLRVLPHDRR